MLNHHVVTHFPSSVYSADPRVELISFICTLHVYVSILPAVVCPVSVYLLKKLLISGLLLGSTSGSLGLDGAQLGLDGRGVWVDLVSCLEVLDGGIFVLEADAGETTAVQGLGAISVLGTWNGEGRGGAADGVGPSLSLDAHEGAVVVEDKADGIKRSLGGRRFVIEVRVFVEVADTFFVLFEGEVEVTGLERLVAKVLAGGCDLEDLLGG